MLAVASIHISYCLLLTTYCIMYVMNLFHNAGAYFVWHYSQGIRDLSHLWGSLIAWAWHFFSIPQLLRTLFSPWQRMDYKLRQPGLHPGQFFGDLIISLLMRLFGFLVRIPTILLGLILLVFMCFLFPLAVLIWLLLPPLSLALIVFGLWITVVGL